MKTGPDISVILPCYKSASLAHRSVEQLEKFLSSSPLSFEIIVVDDGGGDFAADAFSNQSSVHLIRLPQNLGKGGAVRAGMKAAVGDVRVFTDIDLPYDMDLILVIHEYISKYGFHSVIGDRTLPGSSYAMQIGWARRLASAAFTVFVGRIVTSNFFDTQCGLKGFRADISEELFQLGRIERFAFDAELIYLMLIHKLDIKRIPVKLRNNETSSVRIVRDSTRMAIDVLSMKWHRMMGHYRSAKLRAIISDEFDTLRAQVLETTQSEKRVAPEEAKKI